MSIFPYIVTGGKDAMELDVVASSALKVRVAFVLMLGGHGEYDRVVNRSEEALVLDLVETVVGALNANVNCVEDMGTPTHRSLSIREFQQARLSRWEDGSEPLHVPTLVMMESNGLVTGIMACEGWFNVGGPWPYHDSYTYATYLKDEAAQQRVLAAVSRMCERSQIPEPELVPLGALE